AIDHSSGKLVYPDFVETVLRVVPLYYVRAAGGGFYLLGFVIMGVNVWKTIRSAGKAPEDETVKAPPIFRLDASWFKGQTPHRVLEGLPTILTVLSLCAVLVGTLVEIVPMLTS